MTSNATHCPCHAYVRVAIPISIVWPAAAAKGSYQGCQLGPGFSRKYPYVTVDGSNFCHFLSKSPLAAASATAKAGAH